jgi:hypothetical protein
MNTSLAKFRDIVLQLLSLSYISYFCLFFCFKSILFVHLTVTNLLRANIPLFGLFTIFHGLNTFPRQKINKY